ncbi:serine/threonine protein phosphatase [Monoraphidium neglectum]|uniref:Protein phosphatase n=1 Tax=Monoraphidium neglectum TaxID=145388 RepID=A0A0D2MTY8_9CHLO|nr:serine/threonine protein phosphatase [Monoraphidium neglectum]KIZ06030.1 serine/threonine protein phosphatase [Monoraphidium neglectum]|eukprot:XP_013905049.1 serine/threonine protein phosphatase [Monoraphidium neglectum]
MPSAAKQSASPQATHQAAAPQQSVALRLRTGACCLPHPGKASYGGEDAFFVSAAGGGALGVADGVGGWAESNVNPAAYARSLMRVACAFVEGAGAEQLARAAADGAKAPAADNSLSHGSGGGGGGGGGSVGGGGRAPGAGAAVAAAGATRAAADSRGDSGFIAVRQGLVVARSRPLQHWFDCPYQLGAFPEFVEATDTAAHADVFEVPLLPGDVVVVGKQPQEFILCSDGLWDNAYDADILALLPKGPRGAQAAAEAIAAMARAHSMDPEFPSPYTREALQQGYDLSWFDKLRRAQFRDGRIRLGCLTGGKPDDVTVLVAVVEDRPAWA